MADATSKHHFLNADCLGTPHTVTESTGKFVDVQAYEPFGRRVHPANPTKAPTAPTSGVNMGFTGQSHDDDLALIDMGGRVYDPKLARFLTPDPFVTRPHVGQALNRYAYVTNNPLRFVDPTGFEGEEGGEGEGGDQSSGKYGNPTVSSCGPSCTTLSYEGSSSDDNGSRENAQRDGTSVAAETTGAPSGGGGLAEGGPMPGEPELSGAYWFGLTVGLVEGNTPFLSAFDQLLFRSGPDTPPQATVGKGVGQIISGLGEIYAGAQVGRIGLTLTETGFLAPQGVAVAVGGEVMIANGALNVTVGLANVQGGLAKGVFSPNSFAVGARGQPVNVPAPKGQKAANTPTFIGGRGYSAHALDRMQSQGITPTVVENAVQTGTKTPGKVPGTTAHYDAANDLTVITNSDTGSGATVADGHRKQGGKGACVIGAEGSFR